MTLMNKQTKQTASAACEQHLQPPASSPLPLTPTSYSSVSVSVCVCVCVSALSLLATWRRCLSTGKWKCLPRWGDEKGRVVVRWLRVPLISFITTHKSSWFFIFYIHIFEKKKVHNNCPLTRTSLAASASLSLWPVCLFHSILSSFLSVYSNPTLRYGMVSKLIAN